VVVQARIRLSEGTKSDLDVPPGVSEVVALLDGRSELRDVIARAADRLELSGGERSALERDALELVRALLELGALELR